MQHILPQSTAIMEGSFALYEERLFNYRIFPTNRMTFFLCNSPKSKIDKGSLIIQRIHIGPFVIESAVCVTEIFETETPTLKRSGFRYVTTTGHPEKGFCDFFISLDKKTGILSFVIEAYSKSSSSFGFVFGPMARFFQKKFTNEAVSYFCSVIN